MLAGNSNARAKSRRGLVRKVVVASLTALVAVMVIPAVASAQTLAPVDSPAMQSRVWGVLNASSADAAAVDGLLQGYANDVGGSSATRAEARVAVQNVMRAQRAPIPKPPFPVLRTLGTIGVGVAAFELGWKIGRGIDTKWLHLSGDVGTWTGGPIIQPGQMQWSFKQYVSPGAGRPQGAWYLEHTSGYWADIGRDVAIDPGSCINYDAACYGWNDFRGTTGQKKQVNAELFQYMTGPNAVGRLAIWGYNFNGVLCGGNDNWWGRALICHAKYLTEDDMASQVWLDRPIEDYASQSFSSISTITAPEMPVWGAGDWELLRGKIKSDANLEDAINHELDPYAAPDPFRGDGGDSGIPTTGEGHRCEWDRENEPQGSIHPLGKWQEMLDFFLSVEDHDSYDLHVEECEDGWRIFDQHGGVSQPRGGPVRPIMRGNRLGNEDVRTALRSIDSNLRHWVKMEFRGTTQRGNEFAVHWYRNEVTGVNYLVRDFKLKFLGVF